MNCATFFLDTNAKINAQNRGWQWYAYVDVADRDPRYTGKDTWGNTYFTLARHNIGADWGAHGQYGSGANAYGYPYAPFMSGAPAGLRDPQINPGGGQVWIVATGTATVNGKILTDGTANVYGPNSGGGIWLCASKIVAGTGALLSAKGGTNSHGDVNGGGTGGRISLGIGLTAVELADLAAGKTPEELELNYLDTINELPADASGGRGGGKDANGNYIYRAPGTATTVYGSLADTAVVVQGAHADIGSPEPGYGVSAFERGTSQTFLCEGYGYNTPTERFSCIGYVVSNATAELMAGSGNTVNIAIGSEPLSLTWLWDEREIRYRVASVAGAGLIVNNTLVDEGDAVVWLAETAQPEIKVVLDEGYEFICWEGPITYGTAKDNPIVLPAGAVREIKPVVRALAEPTTRTWNVTNAKTVKEWTDPTAWVPNGIPGTNDHIVIKGKGTMLASNYFECASLTLSESAAFKVANTASPLLEEAVLVVHGDLSMTNTAALLVAPRNYYRHGRLEVGGDINLDGANTLTVSAGPTNEVEFTHATGAGFVDIAGNLAVRGTSSIIPNCEPYTGGSVVFRVGGVLLVTTNAAFKANLNGFARVAGRIPVTHAPGWGYSYTIGAGYGGYGLVGQGLSNVTYGRTYGFEYAPIHPGSPCGDYNNNSHGGGAIRIHVAGKATIAGRLDASARDNDITPSSASGGGLWLTTGGKLTVEPGAIIKARGGYKITGVGLAGGGGRIALGDYMSADMVAELAQTGAIAGWDMARRDKSALFLAEHPDVTVDVKGGENQVGVYEGTFRVLSGKTAGTLLILR